jgi:oligoribonuclease (3'-5' exoribonuclease)
MGYLANVVQSGKQLADRYHMPEYVEKARQTSYYADKAVGKIDLLLCEQGSPLLDKVDKMAEAKIQATLDLASAKVEQAQNIKTEVTGLVAQKKTKAIELTTATTAKVQATTSEALAIAKKTKMKALEKVMEKKKMACQTATDVCEVSTKTLEKAKATAEQTEYGKKMVSIVKMATESVYTYGTFVVEKSMALPMTLQERIDKGLTYTTDKVGPSLAKAKKKASSVYATAKVTLDTKFLPMLSTMGVNVDLYRAMYTRCQKTGFIVVCKEEYKALMQNKISPYLAVTETKLTRMYANAKVKMQSNIVLAKEQVKFYEDKISDYFKKFKGVNTVAIKNYATTVQAQVTKLFGDIKLMLTKSKA